MPYLEHEEDVRALSPETAIGSGAQATWRIPGRDLAGRHFTIRLGHESATLLPGSPQSVVAVNGRQVPAAGVTLASGDVITAGLARFVYLAELSSPRPRRVEPPAEGFLLDGTTGQAYRLRRRAVTIGRDTASGIVLRDTSVSRHHADVRAEAEGYVLYSSGAAGTTVNGDRLVTPRLLHEGDVVQVGSTSFTFGSALPPGARAVEPAPSAEDDQIARRETVLDTAAITTGDRSPYTRRGPSTPLIAAIVVAILVVAFLLLR
jgi:pSer/pThr/pTyr-binding forkhead associated (FHA) protein